MQNRQFFYKMMFFLESMNFPKHEHPQKTDFNISKQQKSGEIQKKRTYMQAKNVENTTFSKQKNHQNAHILTYSQHYFLTLQTAYDIIAVSTLYD